VLLFSREERGGEIWGGVRGFVHGWRFGINGFLHFWDGVVLMEEEEEEDD
jgi:hypothetical protein